MKIRLIISFFSSLLFLQPSCTKNELEEVELIATTNKSLFDTICPPPPPVAENDLVIASFFNRMFNSGLNGMAMVTRNDTIIYQAVSGFQNFEARDSFKLNTAMQLASVSKQFTAVAILQLVDRGQIKLTDSIQCYYPSFPYHGITIHHLLAHRSGLPNYMYFLEEYCTDRVTPISNQQLVKLMIDNQPEKYNDPDRRYQYSNTGYALLAAIVEKVTGLTFEDYMQIHIFRPAGMNNSWIYNKAQDPFIKNRAYGYTPGWIRYADDYMNGITGDKGVYTTLEDLYHWDQALSNGTLLSQSILEKAYEQYNPGMLNSNYGYGWRTFQEYGHKIAFHFGWWRGFKGFNFKDLNKDLMIVILTNRENVRLNDLTELFNYLYPSNPPITMLSSPRQG